MVHILVSCQDEVLWEPELAEWFIQNNYYCPLFCKWLGGFGNWVWSVAVCLQNTSEQLMCWLTCDLCLSSVDLPESNGIVCTWLDDQDTWKKAGRHCTSRWQMPTDPAFHSDSSTYKELVWNSTENFLLGSILPTKCVFVNIFSHYMPSSFFLDLASPVLK